MQPNIHLLTSIVLAALCVMLLITWAKGFGKNRPQIFRLANIAEGEHLTGKISYTADAAFNLSGTPTRFLLAKQGTDDFHMGICGAADEPLGVCTDAPAAGDLGSVDLLGAAPGTHKVSVTGTVNGGSDLYTAAGGQAQTEPTLAGTYWLIGTANRTVTNEVVEFTAIKPIKVVVVAALTSVQNATTAATDLTTSEALANALKANYNALQADVAALSAALATPALIKHL